MLCSQKRKPILDIWASRSLVKNVSALDQENEIAPLARKSPPERWQRVGKDLFEKRLYKDAHMCFVRAQDHENALHCEALISEREGESFADSGKIVESRRRYSNAAAIYEQLKKYPQAASAYMAAHKFAEAHKNFVILRDYDKALDACSKGKLNSEALVVLKLDDVDGRLKDSWGRKFALSRHSEKDKVNMLAFLGHVRSENVRRAFLERYVAFCRKYSQCS